MISTRSRVQIRRCVRKNVQSFQRDRRTSRQPRQELRVRRAIVGHAKCLTPLSLFIHLDEHRKVLVSIACCSTFFKGFVEVYAKPRCRAFIASLAASARTYLDRRQLLFDYSACGGLRHELVCIFLDQEPSRDSLGCSDLNQRDVLVMCAVAFFNR
jgi:hypothetical protein